MMRAWWILVFCMLFGCKQHVSVQSSIVTLPSQESAAAEIATVPARRIVSLAPGLTELIYAVGAESFLVATVEYSDYPVAAKSIPRVGDAFRIDMERLLALKPDLVLAWTSGTPVTAIEQIKSLGMRVESLDVKHISEVSESLIKIGQMTGLQGNAKQVADTFEREMSALREQYQHRSPLSVFVEVNSRPLYTVNGQHVLSEVLNLCGGRNVFAELNQLAPIIGTESVLKANPDVILSVDGTLEELKQEWRQWPQLKAVKGQHLYAVSPDTATRATPRLLQGAKEVCQALDQAREQI
jgi:iron complex transport system substrate-binding protein